MMMRGNRGWIGGAYQQGVMESALESLGYETSGSRLRALEARVADLNKQEKASADLVELATLKLNRGQPVSRKEAAAFLDRCGRSLARLENAGGIVRCSAKCAPLRYAASDILRLASAPRRER
jgi:hypothetical protein